MNSLRLKYFSYIVILFSTFIAYSNEEQVYQDLLANYEATMNVHIKIIKERSAEVFREGVDRVSFIEEFVAVNSRANSTSLHTMFLHLYVNDSKFRDWLHQFQLALAFYDPPEGVSIQAYSKEELYRQLQSLELKAEASSWEDFILAYIDLDFQSWVVVDLQPFMFEYEIK